MNSTFFSGLFQHKHIDTYKTKEEQQHQRKINTHTNSMKLNRKLKPFQFDVSQFVIFSLSLLICSPSPHHSSKCVCLSIWNTCTSVEMT